MKQKLLTFLLLIACVGNAWGIRYSVDNGYAWVVRSSAPYTYADEQPYSGDVVILKEIVYKGVTYPVTSIGGGAFEGYTGLTTITIPEGVTRIDERAFKGCSGLTSITIPEGLTIIGGLAFSGCSGLTSITIPEGVTSIGYNAFEGCSGLTSINIPEGVASIGSSAFSGCSGLTSITILEGLTSIGSSAFSGCTGLTSLTLPEGVTSIGSSAFSGCSGLTSINIPEGVTSIGSQAFKGCSNIASLTWGSSSCSPYEVTRYCKDNLKEVTLLDGLTSIGGSAFDGCSGLTSITIPEGVTSIGSYAFYGCSGLTSITIPDGVTSIGGYAFYGCSGLTSITIPESVTRIGDYAAFQGCSNIASLTWGSSSCSPYEVTRYCKAKLKEVTLLDGLTSIGDNAFSGCSGLTSITIPEGVTSIGSNAFSGCSGLTSITIPEGVTSIDESAFSGCLELTYIDLPLSVKSLGRGIFSGCSNLESVIVPFIGSNYPFGFYFGTSSYDGSYAAKQHLSSTSTTNYYLPTKLKSVTVRKASLRDYSFENCSQIEQIVVPQNIKSIPRNAFYNCYSLTSFVIPESVTSIGSSAFYGCSGLTSITIPESVTSIDDNAFKGTGISTVYVMGVNPPEGTCSFSNADIYVPNFTAYINYCKEGWGDSNHLISLEEIQDGDIITVNNKTAGQLASRILQKGVQLDEVVAIRITGKLNDDDWGIIKNELNLAYIDLSGLNITAIPSSEFQNKKMLKTVILPESIVEIGASAFDACKQLEGDFIFNQDIRVGANAFRNTRINSVTFNGTATVGDYAFQSSTIKTVTFNNNVTIGNEAFIGSKIEEISFLGDANVGSSAFKSTPLVTAYFEGVATVSDYAFQSSTIKTVTFNNNVTIGNEAFIGSKIEEISFLGDANVRSSAFKSTPLVTAYFGGVATVGDYAFQSSTIKEVTFDNNVTIGSNAFENSSLVSAEFGGSVEVGKSAFLNSELGGTLHLDSRFKSIGNSAFSGTQIEKVIVEGNPLYPACQLTSESCFANCNNLKDVVFNDSLEMIGKSVFDGCTNLSTIKWPKGLTTLDDYCFRGTGFEELMIPEGVQFIGRSVFDNSSSLKTLDVPATVEAWNGSNLIAGCPSLEVLSVHWNTPLVVSSTAFSKVDCTKVQLWIPYFTSTAYLKANGWKDFNRNIYERYGTVTVTAGKGGSVEVHGQTVTEQTKDVQLISGMEMVFTITPKAGYMIESVCLDGEDVTEDAEGNAYGMTYTIEEIDDDYTLEVTFVESTEQEVPVFVSAKNRYGTLIVPFDAELPAGLKAYIVDGADGADLTLTAASSILANTAYVIENTTAEDINTTISGTVVNGYEQGNTTGLLTGVYTKTEAPVGCYVLQNHDGVVAFYRVDGGLTTGLSVGANRCYLNMGSNSSNVKVFYLDGQATGIENLEMAADKAVIYDLSGRRVSKAQKGLYIVNGKKVMK